MKSDIDWRQMLLVAGTGLIAGLLAVALLLVGRNATTSRRRQGEEAGFRTLSAANAGNPPLPPSPLNVRRATPPPHNGGRRHKITRPQRFGRAAIPTQRSSPRRWSGSPRSTEVNDPDAVQLVGARIDVARQASAESRPTRLDVELRLFAESSRRHWETGSIEARDVPLTVRPEDLEAVIAVIVPDRLPELAAILSEAGVMLDPEALEQLPFAVEPSRRLERELVKRRFGL